jgi:hypothetical protein
MIELLRLWAHRDDAQSAHAMLSMIGIWPAGASRFVTNGNGLDEDAPGSCSRARLRRGYAPAMGQTLKKVLLACLFMV